MLVWSVVGGLKELLLPLSIGVDFLGRQLLLVVEHMQLELLIKGLLLKFSLYFVSLFGSHEALYFLTFELHFLTAYQ